MLIAAAVSKTRPSTTWEEVQKKIQTLRTQMGQEINKIEKSREHNDENLIYTPKIWWWGSFEWVCNYMKGRSDPSVSLSEKIDRSYKSDQSSTTFNLFNDDDEATSKIEIEEEEEVYEPPPPKIARKTINTLNVESNNNQSQTRTIQYIFSNEDPTEIIATPHEADILDITSLQQSHELIDKEKDDHDRCKKRSKHFGKYVASLMQDFKDDNIFFETQNEILKVIQKATLKKYYTPTRINK